MSLFKKKRISNIRERTTTFEEDDDGENCLDDLQPSLVNKSSNGAAKKDKKKNKYKDEKKLAVNALSFEDELEGL